ncbi:MAG: hypothetical protein A2341_21480 [Deltaproteobacteria bacterium RIFOXYB12_FULL_58_9]|nr:MAG: hypothetical protein A2341_21480 [Deltaproteobacteria bacterium RIFOXYB12_FULL_58_9]
MSGHLTTPGAVLPPAARSLLGKLQCDLYVLPGVGESRENLDIKRCKLLDGSRFDLRVATSRDGERFEILSMPNELSFWQWNVLPKNHRWRVVVTNAGVLDLPETLDENAPGIDADFLRRLGVDYAAIGCVHETIEPRRCGETGALVGCAGSARITEAGEVGPRVAILVEFDEGVRTQLIPLVAAGQSRAYVLRIEPNGEVPNIDEPWHPNDTVTLRLHGIVEDEDAKRRALNTSRERWGSVVRHLGVDVTGLVASQSFIHAALARRLVTRWQARDLSDPSMRVFDIGVKAITEES